MNQNALKKERDGFRLKLVKTLEKENLLESQNGELTNYSMIGPSNGYLLSRRTDCNVPRLLNSRPVSVARPNLKIA